MGKGIVKLGEGNWAVKDGNLLAAKETNGRFKNAEFTVARGTRATYVGKDGLIKESNLQDVNLVNNGDFTTSGIPDTSSYTLGWYSNTDGVEIANGKLTLANDASGAANAYATDGVSSTNILTTNKIYKLTFDITDNTNCLAFQIYQNAGSFVSVTNTVGSYTYYITNTSNSLFLFRNNTVNSSISLDNVSVQEVKTDTPRIDFTDNTDGHLLLEPQSTNLITYSEDFSEWTFLGNTDINATNITSPSGENNATNITGLNGSGSNDLRKQITYNTANKTLTFSVYLKGSGTLRLQMSNGVDQAFQEVITLTNQWERYSVSETFNSTSVSIFYLVIDDYSGLTATSYDIWGAQLEELSHPTSYIPTNGSTVTRDAETCTGAGEAIDFNSSEGVLYAEIAALADDISQQIGVYGGSSTEQLRIEIANSVIRAQLYNGAYQANMSSTQTVTNFNKIAFKWKVNDFALWINGTEVDTDSSGTTFSAATLDNINFSAQNGSSSKAQAKVKALRVYKEALSDTDLGTLTS